MTERPGHFEKGVWIDDKEPAAEKAGTGTMEKRFADATQAVIRSIDAVAAVTRDLVITPEGRQYIEKTMKETQDQIRSSVDAVVARAKAELEKKKKL